MERMEIRTRKSADCWEWLGRLDEHGYGRISVGRKSKLAHRIAFALANGRDPLGMVLHSCDNRKCVNPAHLREGDAQDNSHDMVVRGRSTRGPRNPNARLSSDDVRAIREMSESSASVARSFGISKTHAQRIRTGTAWRHE